MSKAQKLIQMLMETQHRVGTLREARTPLVGIFYEVDGQIISLDSPVDFNMLAKHLAMPQFNVAIATQDVARHTQYIGQFRDTIYNGYSFLHIDMFTKVLKKLYPDLEGSWQDIPRGRVVYNVTDSRFEVLMDPCLLQMTRKILQEFNLPAATMFDTSDVNYRCQNCRS